MQQMELNLGEVYDIYTDTYYQVDHQTMSTYAATHAAYGQVRLATAIYTDYKSLVVALDRIHYNLQTRIINS